MAHHHFYVHNVQMVMIMVLLIPLTRTTADKSMPRGHLEKFGLHRAGRGITMNGRFSNPSVLFGHFVKPSKPLWFKSALENVNHPGLRNWTDEYLRKHYGNEPVKIEISKKENRQNKPKWLSLRQFLSLYEIEDLYMVHSLNNKMQDLVLVPSSLQCGGFQKSIQDAVMWLGSDVAMSVLHYDELDNLLCLLDGHKEVVLIDPTYKNDIEADGFVQSGGYSLVDVERVDLEKFPRITNIHWNEARLDKGDCLFIPKGWYHQVTSSTKRHLAVNLWFSHIYWFNSSDCPASQTLYKPLEPISTFGFASPNEVYRSKLLEQIHNKDLVTEHVFTSSVKSGTEERKVKFFHAVDKYKDKVLAWGELYGFDIDKAVLKFPDIFGLPGVEVTGADEEVILYDIPSKKGQEEEEFDGEEDTGTVDGIGSSRSMDSVPLPDDHIVHTFDTSVDGVYSESEGDDSGIYEKEIHGRVPEKEEL